MLETPDAPVAVVTRLYQCFSAGDLDATFDLMAPTVVLREPGDPRVLPWAGEFHGHEGLRRFYDGLAAGLADLVIEAETLQVKPVGEHLVLVMGTERGVSAATGRGYTTSSAWVWEVHGGRITRLVAYHDTAAMERAFVDPC